MAERAHGGNIQQESSVWIMLWGGLGFANHEQKCYGDLQNPGQTTRQDSTDSKEAKSVRGSRGEYLRDPAMDVY